MFGRKFWFLIITLFLATFFWAGGGNLVQVSAPRLPEMPAVEGTWEQVYRIFALKSAVQAKLDNKNYVKLEDMPLTLQQAVIAVEDNRFYHHFGFDIEGILRAALVNLQTSSLQEGGSTITQQLVKNLFLTQDRTMGRKLEEFILALDMELRYSKEEILEIYLNTIYFGSGAKGIGPASQIYFGKPCAKLTLAESAMLAGLPNAPSLYSPYVDFNAAKQRQAVVLAAMVKNGYIGPSLALQAKEAPMRLAK